MYKITHFQKHLVIDNSKPYGYITVYFGSKKHFKETGRISLSKFLALSNILENDNVAYDAKNKIFVTNVEASKFINPTNRKIS